MKFAIALFGLIGCATTHSLPPENYNVTQTAAKKPAIEVTVKSIQDLPKVQGQSIPEEDNEQLQALSKAIEKSVKGDACTCRAGDPLCSCIGYDNPNIIIKSRQP